jgi:hypothetical protein
LESKSFSIANISQSLENPLHILSLSLNPHFIFSLLRKQIIKIKALGGELRPIGSERLSLSLSLSLDTIIL